MHGFTLLETPQVASDYIVRTSFEDNTLQAELERYNDYA